jgi:HPt (histidine-containing phosphotransfer) domain-containing protein
MDKIIITPDEETADLLPGYVERRRAEVAEIEKALALPDFTRLATMGHNIKGTAGSYGIPGLGEFAEQLHTAAVNGDLTGCHEALAGYKSYLARVEVAEIA